jgi:hypothetical protein
LIAIIVLLWLLLLLGAFTGLRSVARSGPMTAFAVPYVSRQAATFGAVGGAAWTCSTRRWRVTGPLMRLELAPDTVRIGPRNRALGFLTPTFEIPRSELVSVAPLAGRGLRPACVRLSTRHGDIDFWGASSEVVVDWYRHRDAA